MKKLLVLLIVFCFIICSCADDKTFVDENGKTFTARTYGWADKNIEEIEGVKYNISIGNGLWSVILCQTIVVPVILTGWYMYEPVSYEPIIKKDTLHYKVLIKDSIN